ncbi:MAG TPA: CPBP family glutamic-type intramembrane protease [Microlunatus sp.]
MRAIFVVASYLALMCAGSAGLGLVLLDYGVESEWLLLMVIPVAGVLAFVLMSLGGGGRQARRTTLRPTAATWTAVWLLLGASCLQLAASANEFMPSVVLFLITTALGEELAFRRLPVALQLRAGLLGTAPSALFAAVTTAVFVLIHDTTNLVPTVEKITFGICAYYACLWTRSVLLPLAMHLVGNAWAAIWVHGSGTNAAVWFSASSTILSAIAVLGLSQACEHTSDGPFEGHFGLSAKL